MASNNRNDIDVNSGRDNGQYSENSTSILTLECVEFKFFQNNCEESQFSYDVTDGRYEGYRDLDLSNAYTAYRRNGANEAVYDRYEYDYEEFCQRPEPSFSKKLKTCCSDLVRFL